MHDASLVPVQFDAQRGQDLRGLYKHTLCLATGATSHDPIIGIACKSITTLTHLAVKRSKKDVT